MFNECFINGDLFLQVNIHFATLSSKWKKTKPNLSFSREYKFKQA